MKKWTTKIVAISSTTGDLVEWCGPIIEAPSMSIAQEYCWNNGLGYCEVDGELIAEIPCDDDGNPDTGNMIDYDIINNN